MKSGIIRGCVVLLTVMALAPMLIAAVWAQTTSGTSEVTSGASAEGRGWFVFNGLRHNFAFTAKDGKLNEKDGWRYAPTGHFSLGVVDRKENKIFNVGTDKIWRFRIDEIDGGYRVVFAGVINFRTPKGVLEGWWFRAEARDIDDASKGADGVSISLWRPGGAGNPGCWTARLFKPTEPRSVQLNPVPFYLAFGKLRGGSVEATP